jgi:hypothetical protein
MTEVEGAVLAIQGDELVLDLGASRGASDGATVELWRPVKLKHPVTGKVLTDRFRIGTLELTQVRGTMTLARASGALARPAEVGDVVILAVAAPAAPAPAASAAPPSAQPKGADTAAPWPPSPSEERTALPSDPEARAVSELFESLKGTDLWTRIRRYEAYARARPDGRYARALSEEAAALRELVDVRSKVAEHAVPHMTSFARPQEGLAGAPLRIAVELSGGAAGAVLQVRQKGAPGYTPLSMAPIGHGYFAAVIPADRMVAPALEYFIEATSASGRATAVTGSADSPWELEVFQPPHPYAPRKLPSHVEIATDYADYNRLHGNDYAFQTEGWGGVRYGDVGVRALRTGFGVYRGVGGSVDQLDKQMLSPRRVGLTYGWLEAEFGIVRVFSLGGRVTAGLIDSGITGGGQIEMRIGSDLGTNLLVAGEFLGGVGPRGIIQLELATFPRWPIVLRTEVTNQPAGVSPSTPAPGTSTDTGNVGARGIVQLGYKFTPDFFVALRGSFQGRTIQHFGPGGGGAVGYSW